jgi:hypothetical protein
MRFRRLQRTFFLWAASLAVLLGAVAPTISVALQNPGDTVFGQICTSQSATWNSGDGNALDIERRPAHSIEHLFEHCPYCSLHVANLGMPPAGISIARPLPAFARSVFHEVAAPALRFWAEASPRGPPPKV